MRTTRLRAPAVAGLMLVLAGVLAGCSSSQVLDAVVYKAGPRNVTDNPGGERQDPARGQCPGERRLP